MIHTTLDVDGLGASEIKGKCRTEKDMAIDTPEFVRAALRNGLSAIFVFYAEWNLGVV